MTPEAVRAERIVAPSQTGAEPAGARRRCTTALVLGSMASSGFFNGTMVIGRNGQEARRFLASALSQGFDTLDTAPVYGLGHAERDLGRWLPPEAQVWTKVGVDIDGVLPRLDYSLAGMARSLAGSLERLKRSSVSVAMVHNPRPSILADVDLEGFADHCARANLADRIGVSVLDPARSLPLLAGRLPAGSVVMCEATQLDPTDGPLRELIGEYRLVVRSILDHGALVRGTDPARHGAVVRGRVEEVVAAYAPSAVVIGPRTTDQLVDYRPGGRWPGDG